MTREFEDKDILRERREALGLTQEDLAAIANISRGTVRNAEAGKPLTERSKHAIEDTLAIVLPASSWGDVLGHGTLADGGEVLPLDVARPLLQAIARLFATAAEGDSPKRVGSALRAVNATLRSGKEINFNLYRALLAPLVTHAPGPELARIIDYLRDYLSPEAEAELKATGIGVEAAILAQSAWPPEESREVRSEAQRRIESARKTVAARRLQLARQRRNERSLDPFQSASAARISALELDAEMSSAVAADASAHLQRLEEEALRSDDPLLATARERYNEALRREMLARSALTQAKREVEQERATRESQVDSGLPTTFRTDSDHDELVAEIGDGDVSLWRLGGAMKVGVAKVSMSIPITLAAIQALTKDDLHVIADAVEAQVSQLVTSITRNHRRVAGMNPGEVSRAVRALRDEVIDARRQQIRVAAKLHQEGMDTAFIAAVLERTEPEIRDMLDLTTETTQPLPGEPGASLRPWKSTRCGHRPDIIGLLDGKYNDEESRAILEEINSCSECADKYETLKRHRETRQAVVSLYESGKSVPEIKHELGITRSQIYSFLHGAGVPIRDDNPGD